MLNEVNTTFDTQNAQQQKNIFETNECAATDKKKQQNQKKDTEHIDHNGALIKYSHRIQCKQPLDWLSSEISQIGKKAHVHSSLPNSKLNAN